MKKTIPVERYAYYHLTTGPRGGVIDINGNQFCPAAYSRFKHGDTVVQREYGHRIADSFALLFLDPIAVVAPFAYMNVQTAAGNMMEFIHQRIGQYRMERQIPCVGRAHLHKEVDHSNHRKDHLYASSALLERLHILRQAPLSVDFSRLRGKTAILIDDIRITGSSEMRLLELLSQSKAERIIFLYVATMDPTVAVNDPGIESVLNQWYVKSLEEMGEILRSGQYRFNLRNCKFILERSESEDMGAFLVSLDDDVLLDFWSAVLANSYYMEPAYLPAIKMLCATLQSRSLIDSLPDDLSKASHYEIKHRSLDAEEGVKAA